MPNLTRSDLVTRIADLIGDPSETQWTAVEKQRKIDEWQEKFIIDTRALLKPSTFDIVAGTNSYTLPTDILGVERVTLNGIELSRMSKVDFDFYTNRDWTTDTGTPTRYYISITPSESKIYLHPTPQAADAGTLNGGIEYIAIPTALTSDTDVPFDSIALMSPYHMAIAFGAAADLLLMMPSPENVLKVQGYRRQYQDFVDACVNHFRHMRESAPLRMKGGRYYKGM